MKHLIIFCDGTWQNLSQRFPTNVTRAARAVAPATAVDGRPTPQIVFYDDGVGVGQGVLDSATRLLGGALGRGLDRKIMEAYEFLVLNYEPGDRVYIFGFSRGAYTARSLAGLLRHVWILKRENASQCERAVQLYREHDKDAVETDRFRNDFCHPGEAAVEPRAFDPTAPAESVEGKRAADAGWIQYLGVWDTVGALGVPRALPFSEALNGKYEFHDTALSRFVFNARHAVALDERREAFAPTLWSNVDGLNGNARADALAYPERPYQQVWFPGGHGAVGGGAPDGGISLPPLLWILEGATRAGLAFDPAALTAFAAAADPCARLPATERGFGEIMLELAGMQDRDGPAALDEVSAAARTRWLKLPTWRPNSLRKVAARLGA
jgi:uncharacterized protein (DUF2235 family)